MTPGFTIDDERNTACANMEARTDRYSSPSLGRQLSYLSDHGFIQLCHRMRRTLIDGCSQYIKFVPLILALCDVFQIAQSCIRAIAIFVIAFQPNWLRSNKSMHYEQVDHLPFPFSIFPQDDSEVALVDIWMHKSRPGIRPFTVRFCECSQVPQVADFITPFIAWDRLPMFKYHRA